MVLQLIPDLVDAAAGDLRAITIALDAPTGIVAAAADEVSAEVTALFNSHGQFFQGLLTQARSFLNEFTQLLTQTVSAYQATEHSAANLVRADITVLEQPLDPLALVFGGGVQSTAVAPTNVNPIGLVLSGTGSTTVLPDRVASLQSIYGLPPSYAVSTPEQLFPFTPYLGSLTLDQSVAQGTVILDSTLRTQLALGHEVTVWGSSQSAIIETNEIRNLMTTGSPGVKELSFILTGDPDNPNGGVFERFTGLHIPGFGITFNGATPPDSPYTTMIFTNQYDPVADFPQYPLNVVSDANAVMGLLAGDHFYTQTGEVTNTIMLPTSPGYTGHTTYFIDLTQNLPLVAPLRLLPYGNALADLLQPDLRVIVDMGYGNGYANTPTTASLIEHPNWPVVLNDLSAGAVQGPEAALVDLGVLPSSYYPIGLYPFSPTLNPGLNY